MYSVFTIFNSHMLWIVCIFKCRLNYHRIFFFPLQIFDYYVLLIIVSLWFIFVSIYVYYGVTLIVIFPFLLKEKQTKLDVDRWMKLIKWNEVEEMIISCYTWYHVIRLKSLLTKMYWENMWKYLEVFCGIGTSTEFGICVWDINNVAISKWIIPMKAHTIH